MDLTTVLSLRPALYGLLQELYSYPLSWEKVEPLRGLESEEEGLAQGLALLRQALPTEAQRETFLENLNVEYTRLFSGPGFIPAPPYASFYLNNGFLMGPEARSVRRLYLQWQVIPRDRLPDDHLALELGFMAYLSGETQKVWNRAEEAYGRDLVAAQKAFLNEHLKPWIPRFCADLAAASPEGFFAGLSEVTRVWVEADREFLEELSASTRWERELQ